MERKFLEKLGITDKDTIDKILDENSVDIGKTKGELNTIQKNLTNANAEIETLKKSTGDVEELKKQIETLQTDNKAKDEAH